MPRRFAFYRTQRPRRRPPPVRGAADARPRHPNTHRKASSAPPATAGSATAIAAAGDDNVGDGALVGAQYLVATLGLLSFAVTNGVWGANLAHVHADQMPRAQALALFIGADLASLPWIPDNMYFSI